MRKTRTYCYLTGDQRQFIEDFADSIGGDSLSGVLSIAVNHLIYDTMWSWSSPMADRLAEEAGVHITDDDRREVLEFHGKMYARSWAHKEK